VITATGYRIPDTGGVAEIPQNLYYIDILDPRLIKSTPGGKRGVSGVSEEE
jgi:hypothetical protein